MSALFEFDRLTKRFGGVTVLDSITLAIEERTTLGLVGENGAGKSTLMNILGGNLAADAGHMRLAGQDYRPASPAEASEAGVAFVHQELNLFPNLSIAENLFLTRFPTGRPLPLIHRAALRRSAGALLREVGLEADPNTAVERLSAGERQLVEIAKALSGAPRLVILDEPTTSLSDRETERLFSLMGRLRARGMTMVFISHTIEDVLRVSDNLAVLRDGQLVAVGPRKEFDLDRLVALMVGRKLTRFYPVRKSWDTSPTEVGAKVEAGAAERAGLAGGSCRDVPGASAETPPAQCGTSARGGAVLQVIGLGEPGIVRDIRFDGRRPDRAGTDAVWPGRPRGRRHLAGRRVD